MPWPPTSPTPGNLLAFEFASTEGTPCSNPLALTSCVNDPSKPVPCGSSCISYGQVRACFSLDICISRGSCSADQPFVRAFLLTAASLKWSGNSTARALHTRKFLACTTTVQCCATDVSQGEQCPPGTECLADGGTCSKCRAGLMCRSIGQQNSWHVPLARAWLPRVPRVLTMGRAPVLSLIKLTIDVFALSMLCSVRG